MSDVVRVIVTVGSLGLLVFFLGVIAVNICMEIYYRCQGKRIKAPRSLEEQIFGPPKVEG